MGSQRNIFRGMFGVRKTGKHDSALHPTREDAGDRMMALYSPARMVVGESTRMTHVLENGETTHMLPCGCEPAEPGAQAHDEYCRRRAAEPGQKQRDAVERMFTEREVLWRLAHGKAAT
jgi:hypothetical protein